MSGPAADKRSISDAAISWLRLSLVRGIGPLTGRQLLARFGDIDALWQANREELAAIEGIGPRLLSALLDSRPEAAREVAGRCLEQGIGMLCPDDAHWPSALRHIEDAPLVLFVRGDTRSLNHPAMLAVVGARRASQEGRTLTRRWCRYLSERGVAIVSGMAAGIDAAAHRGALQGPSPTIAVLGCGLGSLNGEQQARVAAVAGQGCVVSEFLPDMQARPEHFPRRNRVIAALAAGTLVMEADIRSGSLITARQAAGYGREVMAVPGSVLGGCHAGCHMLIREGALLVESATDVMRHLGWQGDEPAARRYRPTDAREADILRAMASGPAHIDMIAETCGLTLPELSPILLALELQGVIERLPGSRYLLAVELEES